MKPSFSQYLLEYRIHVPETVLQQVMSIVASGYFSYIAQLANAQGVRLGQDYAKAVRAARKQYGDFAVHDGTKVGGTVRYPTSELPERYRKSLKLNKEYALKIRVLGDLDDAGKNGAAYFPMGKGSSGSIYFYLDNIPGIAERPGHQASIMDDLEELEGLARHELQHATQDIVLRKHHPKQMELPSEGDDTDKYYTSDIEFHPQITTAIADFKRTVAAVRSRQEVTPEQVQGLLKAFLHPHMSLPTGLLKYKPAFQNNFFNTLFRKDQQKWKKAVKEFHRLASSAN